MTSYRQAAITDEGIPRGIVQAMIRAGLGPGFHWAGPLELCDAPVRVAVIGSRQCGAESEAAISALAGSLARAGAVVVSGAAVGTDMAAHRGALAAGGATIACVPCGLETIDERTFRQGALVPGSRVLLVSVTHPRQEVTRQTPVIRNRLVAALADAVVVGETPLQSGTHHCRGFAERLGARVFFLDSGPAAEPALALAQQGMEMKGARRFTLEEAGLPALAAEVIAAAKSCRLRMAQQDSAQMDLIDNG
jgi:predicted Rossmann fold nucleotide-binding protein DprA/Smf involved in DNA uptake